MDNDLQKRLTIKEYVKKYERHVAVGALVFGFIVDSLTLVRPDQLFGNVILLSYLTLSALGIMTLVFYEKKAKNPPFLTLPLIQFSFGNLAGGLMVLYGRSGTLEGSYLFFTIFIAFIVGNEFLRNHYARLNFNISAWYFLFLAYLALVIPIVIGKVGTGIFFISEILSLIIIFLFLYILYKVSRAIVLVVIKKVIISVSIILVIFTTLYLTNIIPPVPLSLREIGIYHKITRTFDGNYTALYQKPSWFEFYRSSSKKFTRVQGTTAYCFSSVFVPVRIGTGIYHRFEYLDIPSDKWQTVGLVNFSIVGGRDNGYRGYSEKTALRPGTWRCSVETKRGALIGRTTFEVVDSLVPPLLKEKKL